MENCKKKTDKSPEFQAGTGLFNVIIPSNSLYFVHEIVSRLKTCIKAILVSSLLFTLFPFYSFQEISTHHKGTTENSPEETMNNLNNNNLDSQLRLVDYLLENSGS